MLAPSHTSEVENLSQENPSYWQRHIASCSQSDLTRKAYCRQHQINYSRFQYWYHKFNAHGQPAACIPIKLTASSNAMTAIATLELSSGHRFLLYDSQLVLTLIERMG